jgi:hypothetical protein
MRPLRSGPVANLGEFVNDGTPRIQSLTTLAALLYVYLGA